VFSGTTNNNNTFTFSYATSVSETETFICTSAKSETLIMISIVTE